MVVSLVLWMSTAMPVRLQAPVLEDDVVTPTEAWEHDLLGSSCAVGRDGTSVHAVFGSPGAHGPVPDSGTVLVYSRDASEPWYLHLALSADEPVEGGRFGAAVAATQNARRILVGEPGYGPTGSEGRAHLFRWAQGPVYAEPYWKLNAELGPVDPAPGAEFGAAVAVAKPPSSQIPTFLFVGAPGAPGANGTTPGCGAVYVFHRTASGAWDQFQKLSSPLATAGARFGASLSMAFSNQAPDTLVVGAPGDESAFVFTRDTMGTATASDDEWIEGARLLPVGGAPGDGFGTAVALRRRKGPFAGAVGDTIVVGSPAPHGGTAGSVSVFRVDDSGTPMDPVDDVWTLEAAFSGAPSHAGDGFGTSVFLDDTRLVVGAPGDPHLGGPGLAHVFERDDAGTPSVPGDDFWSPVEVLAPPGPVPSPGGGGFGASVGIHSGDVVIGSSRGGTSPAGSGAAFVFRESAATWNGRELPRRFAFDHADDVDIDGDWMAIGKEDVSETFQSQGVVFVFRWDGAAWRQTAKLTAPDAGNFVPTQGTAFDGGGLFGASVALDGEHLVAGARNMKGGVPGSGAAYLFRRDEDEWKLEAKLVDPDPEDGDDFGSTVDVDGSTVVVAAASDDLFHTFSQPSSGQGSIHVFQLDDGQWSHEDRFTADAPTTEAFGHTVAVSGHRIVAGAFSSLIKGRVYLYERIGPHWVDVDRLVVPWTQPSDRVGWRVDVDGERIVAASAFGIGGLHSRSWVFRLVDDDWIIERELYGGFDGVSIDGSRILTGDSNFGASTVPPFWLYELAGNEWQLASQLTATGGALLIDGVVDGDRVAIENTGGGVHAFDL